MQNNQQPKDAWIGRLPTMTRFQKFSQTGEEGFVQFILDNIGYKNRFLVDIGAWDSIHLSNSKYFLEEQGFTGLLIDGDNRGNPAVKQEWITAENICDILKKYDCPEEFDYLTLDVDGMDSYIIEAILTKYKPSLILSEVNGTIPIEESKTVAYNPSHTWNNDDYYGYSFSAGLKIFDRNGYKVVFQNDSLNMYAVRKDLLANDFDFKVGFIHNKYHPHNPTGKWVQV